MFIFVYHSWKICMSHKERSQKLWELQGILGKSKDIETGYQMNLQKNVACLIENEFTQNNTTMLLSKEYFLKVKENIWSLI